MSALAKLEKIWKMKKLKLKGKFHLLRAVVNSILLYACESWTMMEKIQGSMEAFKMKCY